MNKIPNIYVKVLFGDHERESNDSDQLITSEWIPLTVFPPGSVRKTVNMWKWGRQVADENRTPKPLADTSELISICLEDTNIYMN